MTGVTAIALLVLRTGELKRGKSGVDIENDKYILFLNIFDKTCKIFLFYTCLNLFYTAL